MAQVEQSRLKGVEANGLAPTLTFRRHYIGLNRLFNPMQENRAPLDLTVKDSPTLHHINQLVRQTREAVLKLAVRL